MFDGIPPSPALPVSGRIPRHAGRLRRAHAVWILAVTAVAVGAFALIGHL